MYMYVYIYIYIYMSEGGGLRGIAIVVVISSTNMIVKVYENDH